MFKSACAAGFQLPRLSLDAVWILLFPSLLFPSIIMAGICNVKGRDKKFLLRKRRYQVARSRYSARMKPAVPAYWQ